MSIVFPLLKIQGHPVDARVQEEHDNHGEPKVSHLGAWLDMELWVELETWLWVELMDVITSGVRGWLRWS